jgi:hypothetical protein
LAPEIENPELRILSKNFVPFLKTYLEHAVMEKIKMAN